MYRRLKRLSIAGTKGIVEAATRLEDHRSKYDEQFDRYATTAR
jgi:hypothetical protein